MKVFVHPADHWFSYYLIEALLLEGYEVYTLNEETTDEFNIDEKLLLDFGRNSNFNIVHEQPDESFSYGIFLERQMEILFEQGLFVTNQPITDQKENMTTISTKEIKFIENHNRTEEKAIDEQVTSEATEQTDSGDIKPNSSKTKLHARTLAQWLAHHGLSDVIPKIVTLHGNDDKKSIFFIS